MTPLEVPGRNVGSVILFLTLAVSSPGEVLELNIPVEVDVSDAVSGLAMLSSKSLGYWGTEGCDRDDGR